MAEEVTKELLESLIHKPILSFEVNSGSNEGDNVASTILAIKIITTEEKEINLIYKKFPSYLSNDPDSLSYTTRFFKTETIFYIKVLPLLESILKSSNIIEYNIPCAKYYINNDNDKASSVDKLVCKTVWLEDLRQKGYQMMDKFIGLTFDEISIILNELGKFHATTYFCIKYYGEKIFHEDEGIIGKSFTAKESKNDDQEHKDMITGTWTNAIKLLETIGQKHDWIEKLNATIDSKDAFDLAMRTGRKTDKNYFPLIIHGDLWTNNILLKFDPITKKPTNVKFVDFQKTRRGNIYEELLYFIFCSTTPAFRKEYLNSVLKIYYESFTGFLKNQFNCALPINFTFGSFLDEFNSNLISAYIYMTFAIPLQLSTFSLAAEEIKPADDNDLQNEHAKKVVPLEEGSYVSNGSELAERDSGEMFIRQLYRMIEKAPRAYQRLEEITAEMIEMGVF